MGKSRERKTLEVKVRGRIIARIVAEPDPAAAARQRVKALRGKARVTGDIISASEERWAAESPREALKKR